MQELVSLGIPVKEVYIYILNGIKCMSYEKPRRPPAGLRHILPWSVVCCKPREGLDANQWLNESGIPAKYTQVISLYVDQ